MTKLRALTLLVVMAHWTVAIWHLFLAAKVLPAPNNSVSWLAITLITLGHLLVVIGVWKLRVRPGGLLTLIFFLAALSADLYEHFLHASLNNVFMVAHSAWSVWFTASVSMLLALEILGCFLGGLSLSGTKRRQLAPGIKSDPRTQNRMKPFSRQFGKLGKASI